MSNTTTLFSSSGITESERILHTASEFAKQNLLYIQEVGKLKSLQPHKSQRENLDSYLFIGVLNGEGIINIKQKSFKIEKGKCLLINCSEYYSHESSVEKPWELMWVHFNGFNAKAYFHLFMEQNDGKNIFQPKRLSEMRDLINQLLNCQKEKDLETELKSGIILNELMNKCIFSVLHQNKVSSEKFKNLCNEIRECVNERYQNDELMKYFVDKYDMCEEELNNCFQKAYGISLNDYIMNRRFTAAKELLRFTIKSIEEIIEESGVMNEELFRKLFLDSEGMTAEDYRMKWSQWVK